MTELLAATGSLTPGLSTEEVVDVVYALSSPELYDLFVHQCNWRPERFEWWLVESLRQLALAPSR